MIQFRRWLGLAALVAGMSACSGKDEQKTAGVAALEAVSDPQLTFFDTTEEDKIPEPVKYEVKDLEEISEEEREEIFMDIALAMDYTFPVPGTSKKNRANSLRTGVTSYEFGADRGGGSRKHAGNDFYDYGGDVVAFADGEIEVLGRNFNKRDWGNLVSIDHGKVLGYGVKTFYLHIGGIPDEIEQGYNVKKGDKIARVDCTGIANEKSKLYNPGSKGCRRVAHAHFWIQVEDENGNRRNVNAGYLFPVDESGNAQDKFYDYDYLNGHWSSLPARDLDGRVRPLKDGQRYGSFRPKEKSKKESKAPQRSGADADDLTAKAQKLYDAGKPLFNSKEQNDWCKGIVQYQKVINSGVEGELKKKAEITIGTLEKRLGGYKCE